MNLIIDIGNTNVKTAIFKQDEIVNFQSASQDKILSIIEGQIKEYKPDIALISRVGKKNIDLENLLNRYKTGFKYLSSSLKLPFKIDYKTPKTLGADRIALTAGAIFHKPKGNKLIIDAGTCITYDFVDKNNIYHGGAISPGIDLRFKSLNDYTADLPLLNTGDKKISLIGNNTKSSIKAGVVWGVANEIEGFCVKYNLKYKDLTVFLTGGSKKLLDRYIKNMIFVNSKFLLLEGMNSILNLNK